MTSKVQITFRCSVPNELARNVVSQKFDKLAHQLPYPARCHVVLDRPSGSHHKGARFTARVDIQGAGMSLCTAAENMDPCAAIREAFARVEARSASARERKEARGCETRERRAETLRGRARASADRRAARA